MGNKVAFLDRLLDKTIFFSFSNIGYYLRSMFWKNKENNKNLTNQIVIITGATSGIGKISAFKIAELGAEIHLIGRNLEKCKNVVNQIILKTGNKNIHYHVCDLSHLENVKNLVLSLNNSLDKIDILINNAGVLLNQRIETEEGYEKSFVINVLSGFLLVEGCLELMKKSKTSKVINVSSGGMYATKYFPEDPFFLNQPYDGVMAYARAKRAQVLLIKYWSQEYGKMGLTFAAMHPGWVLTPGLQNSLPMFTKFLRPFLRTPEQGADTIVWLSYTCLSEENNGLFWFDRKPRPTVIKKNTENGTEDIIKLVKTCQQYCF